MGVPYTALDDYVLYRNLYQTGAFQTKPRSLGETWDLRLQSSLLPTKAIGDGTPTYVRANAATGVDFNGLVHDVSAYEPRFMGARRVENLITASEDMTNAGFTVANNAVVDSATQVTFDGTANGQIYDTVTITDDGSGDGGRTFVFSVWVRLISGTPAGANALEIKVLGNAVNQDATGIGTVVTSTAQRFSIAVTTDATGTTISPAILWDDAGTLEITKWQLEEVTGQAHQAPGEYVSTGVQTGGTELITNGEDWTGATGATPPNSWTTTGSTQTYTISSGQLVLDRNGEATSTDADMTQTVTTVIGKTYVITLDFIDATISNNFAINTPDGSTNITPTDAQKGNTFSLPFVADGATADIKIRPSGNVDETLTIDNFSIKEADHGAFIDGVQYFDTLPANVVSSTGVVTKGTGPKISSDTAKWAELDGVLLNSNIFATPNATANDINDELIVGVYAQLTEWDATAQTFASKWEFSTSQRSWIFSKGASGTLVINATDDGTDTGTADTSVSLLPFKDGEGGWVGMKVDMSTGVVTWMYSYDPPSTMTSAINWTEFGTPGDISAETELVSSTANIIIGAHNSGTAGVCDGRIYRGFVINGTDETATPAVDFNPNDWESGLTWESSGANSEVWTINSDAVVVGPKTRWVEFPGASQDYVSSPDSAALDITGDHCMVAYAAADDWTPSSDESFLGKYVLAADQRSYTMGIQGTTGYLEINPSADGIQNYQHLSTEAPDFTNGVGYWVANITDVTNGLTRFFTSTDSPLTPLPEINWVKLGDDVALHAAITGIHSGTAPLEVGTINGGVSIRFNGKIMRAAVISGTDLTAVPVADYDPRSYQRGTTWTASTGEVWTLNGNTVIEGEQFPTAYWDRKGPYGYWSEAARLNRCLDSEDLSAASWTNSESTDTQNAAIAPDGKKTANELVDDGLTGTSSLVYIGQNITLGSGESTFSIYAKDNGNGWVALRSNAYDAGGNGFTWFDLVNGQVGTVEAAHTSTIESVGDGWYRCSVTFTTTTDLAGGILIYPCAADNTVSITKDGTNSVYLWGSDVEGGAFASTYVPTAGVGVTRDKDQLSYAFAGNASYPLTVTGEYTSWIEIIASGHGFLEIGDTADLNNRTLSYLTSGGQAAFAVLSEGVTQSPTPGTGSYLPNKGGIFAPMKITGTVGDDLSGYFNGVQMGTTTTDIDAPVGSDTIAVGMLMNEGLQPFGGIRNVKIFERVLSPTEIKTL